MSELDKTISSAFEAFGREAPQQAQAWMELVQRLSAASALDPKTHSLAFLAVLAALGRENGIRYHVKHAMQQGASREEIVSAILVGLPPAGHLVTEALPAAVAAMDED